MTNHFKLSMMKKSMKLVLVLLLGWLKAGDYKVVSPNGKIDVKVSIGEKTTYTVSLNGKNILAPSPVAMVFENGRIIGDRMEVLDAKTTSVNQMLNPIIKQKSASIKDEYNQLSLEAKDYSLQFRVYDDGVAYRFSTRFTAPVTVVNETVNFVFPENYKVLFPEEKSITSAQQPSFFPMKLEEIPYDKFASTPVLVKPDSLARIVITESNLESYPGMFLKKSGDREFEGKFANYPLMEKASGDRQRFPTKRAYYIAKTEGTRDYPWRVMVIAENDKDLMMSELVYKLAPESKGDFSWVKPGKIAWDWWNANNIYGVDFKSGINTKTYKYFIDFASKYGIEYVVIDDGWSLPLDVTKVVPEMNIEELTAYATKKNVGIILWVSWVPFEEKMDEAFKLFKKWNVKGLKIDFMNRDDQKMVDFYYKTTKKAIDYKMLVNFHGAYKPTGWSRTFPNLLTSEGVAGLENHKWSEKITPTHNLVLPFTRMVAGPMDYTPGAMRNFHAKDFKIRFDLPESIGTRCHQLGMYVVYESPLQMLSDTPTNYYKEPETMAFLSQVPVVWDETRVLEAYVGKYVVVARRKDNVWYIGGMNGDKPMKFNIKLDFIKGSKTMESWSDGVNVDRQAEDVIKKTTKVNQNESITIDMYTGGGFVAIIK